MYLRRIGLQESESVRDFAHLLLLRCGFAVFVTTEDA